MSIDYLVMQSELIKPIEELISQGRFFEARAKAEDAMKESDSLRLKQLYSLAISKSGNPQTALEFLSPLYSLNQNDSETAGILGGIYKDLFKKHLDSKYAILSRDIYSKNFELNRNYYTGINAATMSAIAGRAKQGREIATTVISLIEGKDQGFWELATLGEAYILTRNREKAVECYIKARQIAGNDWGKVISVHNQLWLLNHYLPVPKEVLRIFAPPEVVAFAGHMVDAPGRSRPRFPAIIEDKVKEGIRGAIRTLHASIGYCSLACGGDILFAETMVEEGGEVHILLPFELEDFISTSLEFAGKNWVNRFKKLIESYPVTYITTDHYGGNDDLFALLGKVIFGSAVLRSQTYHQDPNLLTVLSELDLKQQEGGTRDTIKMWPFPLKHININPDIMFSPGEITPSTPMEKSLLDKVPDRPVLFMACVELSELNILEKERLEKMVSTLVENQQVLFKVLKMTDTKALFALDTEIALMDVVRTVWNSTTPFKQVKPIRIGLHAGPVYLNEEADYCLSTLSSISQFAPMGTICASSNLASVLALHPKKFQLDYVGLIKLSEEETNNGMYQVQFRI